MFTITQQRTTSLYLYSAVVYPTDKEINITAVPPSAVQPVVTSRLRDKMGLRSLQPAVIAIVLYWIFFIPESQPGLSTLGMNHLQCDQSVLQLMPLVFSVEMRSYPGPGAGRP